jgi:AP2-associated kinase
MDSAPVLQPTLASTVQPQRRGRPGRESGMIGGNGVPPPSQQISAAASKLPPSATSSMVKPKLPQLQVTGEKQAGPVKQASVDAFGLPAMAAPQKSGSGFGDAFALPIPSTTLQSDAFALPKPSTTLQNGGSRFGSTLPRPASGFGDTFSAARNGGTGQSSRKTTSSSIPSPAVQFPVSFGAPKTTSPKQQSPPAASSSIPPGEQSFPSKRYLEIHLVHLYQPRHLYLIYLHHKCLPSFLQ